MATPLSLQGRSRHGPTFREVLLMHAVGRIAYRGWIDNIQASWVKVGVDGARQLLLAGCNDLGGTLMDENISRAAGADHGQELDEEDFRGIATAAGTAARAAHDALRPRRRPSVGVCDPPHEAPSRRAFPSPSRPRLRSHEHAPGRRTWTSSGSATRSSTC